MSMLMEKILHITQEGFWVVMFQTGDKLILQLLGVVVIEFSS